MADNWSTLVTLYNNEYNRRKGTMGTLSVASSSSPTKTEVANIIAMRDTLANTTKSGSYSKCNHSVTIPNNYTWEPYNVDFAYTGSTLNTDVYGKLTTAINALAAVCACNTNTSKYAPTQSQTCCNLDTTTSCSHCGCYSYNGCSGHSTTKPCSTNCPGYCLDCCHNDCCERDNYCCDNDCANCYDKCLDCPSDALGCSRDTGGCYCESTSTCYVYCSSHDDCSSQCCHDNCCDVTCGHNTCTCDGVAASCRCNTTKDTCTEVCKNCTHYTGTTVGCESNCYCNTVCMEFYK